MRRVALGCLAVLGLMGLAGCGSDDERLTQEEFVSQGNAICQASNDRLDPLFEEAFGDATDENPPTEEEIVTFFEDTFLPELDKQLDELSELNPPEDVEADFDAAVAEARRVQGEVEDDPVAFANSDEDPFEKANELVGKAGLNVCAQEEEEE